MTESSRPTRVERIESLVCRALESLLGVVFMIVFALIVLLVILRYAFNTTIVGGNELSVQLFIYTTALGAAIEIARDKHIIVDFFVSHLPTGWRRRIDIVNLVLIGTFNAFLLKYSIDWIGAVGGSEHPVTHLAEGMVQAAIPISCGLSLLFCAARIVVKLAWKPAAAQ